MKSMRLAAVMAAAVLMAAAGSARANNLVVKNVTVSGRDNKTAYVKFDIAWENSWRSNVNHDAAWVFFKVQTEGDVPNNWQHVTLEGVGTNPTDYGIGTGTGIELVVPSDRAGLFVRRSAEGAGPVSVQNVKAVWNFTSNSMVKADNVRLQALAVEMVYVAEGAFSVGSGGTEPGSFTDGAWTSGATTPFRITSEAALLITNAAGHLWGTALSDVNSSIGGAGMLPKDFPKGYAAFYCMKYEITQGQYRDFLNTLTRAQQATRTGVVDYNGCEVPGRVSLVASNFVMSFTAAMTYRNGIRCPGVIPGAPTNIVFGCDGNTNMVFNETNDAMDRASNLSWADGCAFADWAGLRPMTELEFEKACRGPQAPVADEYAWGTTNIGRALQTEAGDGTGTSTVSTPAGANCCFENGMRGPTRAGIFATTNASRQAAGASYWGITELSGNMWERSVTVGNAPGRAFTGTVGDGVLTWDGNANASNWPLADGAGFRGGSWNYARAFARASDRTFAASVSAGRCDDLSWRGVRAAP